jgi:hypothetical protein
MSTPSRNPGSSSATPAPAGPSTEKIAGLQLPKPTAARPLVKHDPFPIPATVSV